MHQVGPLLEDLAGWKTLYRRILYIFFPGMGYQVRTEVVIAVKRGNYP